MKSQIRVDGKIVVIGDTNDCVEVWHNNQVVATVYATDGPGVRIVSRHQLTAEVTYGAQCVAEVKVREGQ